MPIELDDVSFAYPDGSLAVDGVSITVDDGERVAIVGQNGAGKTTTVKMMNGLFKPTKGVVRVNGLETAGLLTAKIARHVGYVFQNPDDQIFSSTVQAELEYMPRYDKWDDERTARRVRRAAEMSGITEYLDVNPNDLPFAVKKFVAMAAILVAECSYVILDEPTAGLDQRGLDVLNRVTAQLEGEGVGVVTITHDMRFVVENFDRVIVMANKHVIADGETGSVFAASALLKEARLRRPEAAELAHQLALGDALRLNDIVPLIP
ncbi:energy-coupling factor ABC transporter ATP-binding protein [Herbiconiux sp. P17]|uniref:energy-coupling factor ABC transporter ATP-binding protein n=1 Tax=Herbiconiux wuyangfengii TaxID=3342794 RepID=UPI0035BB3639